MKVFIQTCRAVLRFERHRLSASRQFNAKARDPAVNVKQNSGAHPVHILFKPQFSGFIFSLTKYL